MKKPKFPSPKKYKIYISLCVMTAVLLFVNIFVTDAITGNKEFYEFGHSDWLYFTLFITSELLMGLLMFFFSARACKIARQVNKQKKSFYNKSYKYIGIKPGDYNYVWFNFGEDQRALILKQNNVFLLYVEEFDVKSEIWNLVNTISCLDSIEAVKKSLYYDFDFYCDENTTFNEYGDKIFKE